MTTFIQIHALQSVPPSCINRDDTGSPKSAMFGGVKRHRVSSQAWKRAMRNEFTSHLDRSELGVRTLEVIREIANAIQTKREIGDELAVEFAQEIFTQAGFKVNEKKLKKEKDAKAADADATEPLPKSEYLIFLSRSEINALADLAIQLVDGEKPTKKAIREAFQKEQAFDVSLFGRMLANAPELNTDAACQVMHAISTHGANAEFDYFTAVDDLAPEDNAGAGMIGTVEFVSSTLYRYACINFDQLVSNIGDKDAAVRCVDAFIKAFALSMPTGKANTFANRTRPDLVLAEIGEQQPYSLVNAFEAAIKTEDSAIKNSVDALAKYREAVVAEYGQRAERSLHMSTRTVTSDEARELLTSNSSPVNFDDLVTGVAEVLK